MDVVSTASHRRDRLCQPPLVAATAAATMAAAPRMPTPGRTYEGQSTSDSTAIERSLMGPYRAPAIREKARSCRPFVSSAIPIGAPRNHRCKLLDRMFELDGHFAVGVDP